MTTQLITLNEYRKNLSRIWKVSQEKNIRYIVMVHSRPVFEVHPIMSQDENGDYGLHRLPENEVTPEITASIARVRETPISAFQNLWDIETAYQVMSEDDEYQKELVENTKYLGYL